MFPEMLAASDLLLLNQRADLMDAVLPFKFLNYMAAGRPVIAAVHPESETAVYMRKAECGLAVPPEQPVALAEAIQKLNKDKELRQYLGKNGRHFAEAHFSREQVLKRYADLIEGMARQN
jgi:colanic acid biosynthesis glycosyl transferase WcaI